MPKRGELPLPPRLPVRTLLLASVALLVACAGDLERGDAQRASAGSPLLTVAPVQQELAQIGSALRLLRDARDAAEIEQRQVIVCAAARELEGALSSLSARCAIAVDAGRATLAALEQRESVPALPPPARAHSATDLALAFDALLRCRANYDALSTSYLEHMELLLGALAHDHSGGGLAAAAPAKTVLLEDQEDLHSDLTDLGVTGKAVETEIAIASARW